jgi:hypothetical protein
LENIAAGIIQETVHAATAGDVTTAVSSLEAAMRSAASTAGMRPHHPRPRATGQYHQPFYDHECVFKRRELRAFTRQSNDASQVRALENQYHRLVRRKRRAYREQELRDIVNDKFSAPRKFWKRLGGTHKQLPVQLMQVQQWDSYLAQVGNRSLMSGCALPPEAYPQRTRAPAAGLDSPIALEEVENGLRRLHNGRSPGMLGLPSELLRYARATPTTDEPPPKHVLAPALVHVLNSMFDLGTVPPNINMGLVTPIFKRGDPSDPNNYRPIAVTEPILRLYASILNARLVDYTENRDLRCPQQAGFRPGLSTLHPLFTLQHFIDIGQRESTPLYVCFLDLQGAYDHVQRPLLWQALLKLGIEGKMQRAVQSLYDTSTVAMKINGRVGQTLPSDTGVRQGCPLSPTLFGLILDGLARYLQHHCPDSGAALHTGERVPVQKYADDCSLLQFRPT